MPFIAQERRDIIDKEGLSSFHLPGGITPGDRCYLFYKEMIRKWKENPRWAIAHEIFAKLMIKDDWKDHDDVIAASLAWQVFFQLYVMPYEEEKRMINGDI